MSDKNIEEKLEKLIVQLEQDIKSQPTHTWTVAKMKLAYSGLKRNHSLVNIDNVVAAGNCNAHAINAFFNTDIKRIQVAAEFTSFELHGFSNLIGSFKVVLQKDKKATGLFTQRFLDSAYPLFGGWTVPFLIESELGSLIPRPSSESVLLKTAEPGEYSIPPLGTWFEKWDPIDLVLESVPDGPTIAICEHAMHCMLNVGPEPMKPPFIEN